MSLLLTETIARRAVELVMPAIVWAMSTGLAKRTHLAIVILDPKPNLAEPIRLYEEKLGEEEDWDHPYTDIAWGKAEVCWRNQCNSGEVRDHRPFAYQAVDPSFQGGVYMDGLVVACSGVDGYVDEMFSMWIALACLALCRQKMATQVLPTDADTVGEALEATAAQES